MNSTENVKIKYYYVVYYGYINDNNYLCDLVKEVKKYYEAGVVCYFQGYNYNRSNVSYYIVIFIFYLVESFHPIQELR